MDNLTELVNNLASNLINKFEQYHDLSKLGNIKILIISNANQDLMESFREIIYLE